MKDDTGMDNATVALYSEVLARIPKEVELVEESAKGVLIGKESFRVLSRYLESIRSVLQELTGKKT